MRSALLLLFCGVQLASAQQVQLLKDICPGTGDGASLRSAVILKGQLYFAAGESLSNWELWRTDGTSTGTQKVSEINPSGSSYPDHFYTWNDQIWFAASNSNQDGPELYVSDGSMQGTVLVKDLYIGGGSDPRNFYTYGNKLYFEASFHSEDPATMLYRSDGTARGTVPVPFTDISYGIFQTGAYFASPPVIFKGNALIGDAYHGKIGYTDLNTDQTTMLREDMQYYNLKDFTELLHDSLFMFTTDTLGSAFNIWLSNGTAAGTRTVHHSACPLRSSLVKYGDAIYFLMYSCTDNAKQGLWRSDATGTVLIRQFDSIDYKPMITVFNGALYFVANNEAGKTRLWKSNGSQVEMVHKFEAFMNFSPGVVLDHHVVYKSRLFFPAFSAQDGWELWSMDSSGGDVKQFTDLNPGPAHGLDYADVSFSVLGEQLLFEGNNGSSGREIFTARIATGIKEPAERHAQVRLYPNPTNGLLHITGTGGETVNVKIHDLSGRIVYRAAHADNTALDLHELCTGIYAVELHFADGRRTVQKLVRQD